MPNLTKYVKNDNIIYVVEKYWVKKKVTYVEDKRHLFLWLIQKSAAPSSFWWLRGTFIYSTINNFFHF